MQVIHELLNLITNSDMLLEPFTNIHTHIRELIEECKVNSLNTKQVTPKNLKQIEYVLLYLHDHLNIGKWDEVLEYKRQAYTSASFIKSLIVLQLNSSFNADKNIESVKCALKIVDKGFLLGLPLKGNSSLLTDCASLLTKHINSFNNKQCDNLTLVPSKADLPRKKLKIDNIKSVNCEVDVVSCPSIELFNNKYFSCQKPVVIQDCMSIWPAMTKWIDINYLLNIGGERTVPIELGSSYSSEDFSQKLMTLREFITGYYNGNEKGEIGYLAQHDLLTQIPELLEDIKTPEYCCLPRENNITNNDITISNDNTDDEDNVEPEINAWLGPKGTVSSLHYDPKDNLLCQVYGSKQIILFAPSDTKYLYVHNDMPMLSNTSQVDPANPDLNLHPDYVHANKLTCELHSGEMLYIPPKWWHHVTALDKSFSVNFWWK